MKLEAFDTNTLGIRVKCEGYHGWEVLGRLSSLVMVACDCGVQSITFVPPQNIPEPINRALEQLLERSPIIQPDRQQPDNVPKEDFGYFIIGRDAGFLCLRDAKDENKHSIYIAAMEENVELASKCTYLLANILGFTSLLSFEVRFSVYELLYNIIEHGIEDGLNQWIQIALEKRDDKLSVSIVDKGTRFDPTGDTRFDLNGYLKSGMRRGLGLIITRKIAERMQYRSESGFNKIFFEKSMFSLDSARGLDKEEEMSQFTIGEPQLLEDGSYMIPLEGDLDTKGALVMEDLISQLLEEKMLQVVLDFGKVPFVSSAGVGILLGMVSSIRDEGGDVTFLNISPKVASVFRLLNLEDFFTIVESEETHVDF